MTPRPLGQSGIDIAPIALGGNVFGWSADTATSHALLDRFVDAGFNLVDTADAYSAWVPGNRGGESETIIGDWLQRSGKRDRVVIATKVAKWAKHPGLSPANIRAACDDSLKRLGIERIDLYQAHEEDPNVPIEETLGAFSRLIEEGKVRAIGASNYSAASLAAALAASRQHGLPRYETLQPEYNLHARAGYEAELEPLARAEGIGVIGYYALASGFLSGKYRSTADLAKSKARGQGVAKYLDARGLRILARLDEVAARRSATPAQVALAWLIARPGISAPIVSATSLTQLDELLAAADLTLSGIDIAELDSASGY
ncbi:MAG TPA: aldo/keto reductase [Dokdonella sp.]|uniref:aldo/keto reductase n=1 Tax=Dokdonella sp. TaxID=2291710 RepID=UPI0025C4C151|nr:aldo/keto reductase [Dokdonella sp.]MBX3692816.1 aldo/keto reductase [Dokdonella sp.]MCW5569395.1 aldo/keto reductase [Dokdonella sp.]HNR91026.1 aldo/keto reductase [Dokdonella sp.]